MDFSIFALLCISATVAAFCAKKGGDRERTKATGILPVLLGPRFLCEREGPFPQGLASMTPGCECGMGVWVWGLRGGKEGERTKETQAETDKQASGPIECPLPSVCT